METLLKNETSLRNELLSSAFTLSDMEIFVFPDLLYSLVLANIMSPVIWRWRDEPWFAGIENKLPMQRINRVKQYIMNNYVFNLDLETWGLTTKERELSRFKDVISEDILKKSNALFGYEGDRYYFDIDIRRHFGLDRYDSSVIPYWKTETVEAMNAFVNRPGFNTGAGECVSLSALYAAALFIVAEIPLEKIFLIATPLHSQNFIDIDRGVLTNNRRIVTKNMWFNGTSLSTKARRAIENEEITIVSHITGYVHTVYDTATMDVDFYTTFKRRLQEFLTADLTPQIISNFLRKEIDFRSCFQYGHRINGRTMYIPLERIYRYEHTSSNSFSTDSRSALLKEIDIDEFSLSPIPNRILLNDFEEFIKRNRGLTIEEFVKKAKRELAVKKCLKTDVLFDSIERFLKTVPRFPDRQKDKDFRPTDSLRIDTGMSREEIYSIIVKNREIPVAGLSLYSYRDMNNIDWMPFIKAAVERNPVSYGALKGKDIQDIGRVLEGLSDVSIYEGNRLSQPDEVWNFKTGDGIEKALVIANVLYNNTMENCKTRARTGEIKLIIDPPDVAVYDGQSEIARFSTRKSIKKEIKLSIPLQL